jgi:hypothetical protein
MWIGGSLLTSNNFFIVFVFYTQNNESEKIPVVD